MHIISLYLLYVYTLYSIYSEACFVQITSFYTYDEESAFRPSNNHMYHILNRLHIFYNCKTKPRSSFLCVCAIYLSRNNAKMIEWQSLKSGLRVWIFLLFNGCNNKVFTSHSVKLKS